MSTLLEIEEVAATLPPEEKQELILFLTASLRAKAEPPVRGMASDWLRSARGSVSLAPGESVDDARMGFYAGKYGAEV